ncbi:MAG: hypothetical protein AAGD05_18615 [Bacteroidota bacterium]
MSSAPRTSKLYSQRSKKWNLWIAALIGGRFLVLILACNEIPPTSSSIPPSDDFATTDGQVNLLFFKKEAKVEFWLSNKEMDVPQYWMEQKWNSQNRWPPNIFSFDGTEHWDQVVLPFPGDFYTTKLAHGFTIPPAWSATQQSIPLSRCFDEAIWQQLLQQLRGKSLDTILILPNDARHEKRFQSCFTCPHWMAEIYGKLRLELTTYRSPN